MPDEKPRPKDIQTTNPRIRHFALLGYILFLCLVLAKMLYFLYGPGLVTAIYEGRSFGFLNQMITGQAEWALQDYLVKTDRYFSYLFKGGLVTAVSLWLLSLAGFLPLWFGSLQNKDFWEHWRLPAMHPMAVLRRERSGKYDYAETAMTACLSAVPVVIAWIYLFIHKIPFWFYWDPDTSYLMDGLNLLLRGQVHMVAHPGVPCQYLISILLSPFYLYTYLAGLDMPEFCFNHVLFLSQYLSLSFTLLLSLGIFLASMAVKRLVPQTGMAVLACCAFLAASTLTKATLRFNPESLLIFCFGLWMFFAGKMETETNAERQRKYFYSMAFMAGVALAVKITAFPLMIVILFLSLRNFRGMLFSILGFMAGIFPVLWPPHRIAGIMKTIIGQIKYGDMVGAQSGGSFWGGQYLYSAGFFVRENGECLTVFILVLIVLAALFYHTDKNRPYGFPFNIFFLSSVVGFIPALYYPDARYLLIQLFLLLVSGMVALGTIRKEVLGGVVFCLVILTVPLMHTNVQKTLAALSAREEMCARAVRLTEDIIEDPRRPRIVSWGGDMFLAPFALLLANYDSGAVISDSLRKRYPHCSVYVPETNKEAFYQGKLRTLKNTDWEYVFYNDTEANVEALRRILQGVEFEVIRRDPQTQLTVVKIERKHGQR